MRQQLGAFFEGNAAHFRVHASADAVELCLFESGGAERRIQMQRQGAVWVHTENNPPQTLIYGYCCTGPWAPDQGLFFDPQNLLLDPYARNITANRLAILQRNDFDWQGDARPKVPWDKTIIYECHVKGLTQLNTAVPENLRGTYAGLASESVIGHLRSLGVTTVELLPVMAKMHDRFLVEKGLTNFWGYNTVNFFAPEASYAAGESVQEFRTMVQTLHRHGIEVILDVVYNHTAEAGVDGPIFSWRGLDNLAYYHTESDDPGKYIDYTGCGNSLNLSHPVVLHMVIDSLVYWAEEMHVDGFRFDLASTLLRTATGVVSQSFVDTILQHPKLKNLKLIIEPWDLGPGGYLAGKFPVPLREWNDRFRDTMRGILRGDAALEEISHAIALERPAIQFITCHDGFTLADLNSYSEKNNVFNGEDNRDGATENLSCSWGAEGVTHDPRILALRRRAMSDAFCLLLLARGTPMLLAGDELARTQRGNNNAYCQDNEISWLDWESTPDFTALIAALGGWRDKIPFYRADAAFSVSVRGHDQGLPDEDTCSFCVDIAATDSSWQLCFFLNRNGLPVPFSFSGKSERWKKIYSTPHATEEWLTAENGFLMEPFSVAAFYRPLP